MSHNHHSHSHGHTHAFVDPEQHAQRFDGAERDEWQKPAEVIKALQLHPDSVIVEIGAGTGYFTARLAPSVTDGKVYAFDASPQMVAHIQKRMQALGLSNVVVSVVTEGSAIDVPEPADIIMLVDVYHHITDRVAFFAHIKQFLRLGGKIVILDRAVQSPEGPPVELRISPELVKGEMGEAGFKHVEELDFLLPLQFYLSFRKTS